MIEMAKAIQSGTTYLSPSGKEVKVEAIMGEWARIATRQGPRRFARSLKRIADIRAEMATASVV